jgi:hypothetical protein
MKNVREFLYTGRGGLYETHNLPILFHKLQRLHDAIIKDVVFFFAVECCLVLFVHHLRDINASLIYKFNLIRYRM